jgi:hypothetical protein
VPMNSRQNPMTKSTTVTPSNHHGASAGEFTHSPYGKVSHLEPLTPNANDVVELS